MSPETFSILANQAALAMGNCMYWEAEKTRMKEEGLQARLVSLDAMASSFAHEVHNPVQGCMLDLGSLPASLLALQVNLSIKFPFFPSIVTILHIK